MSGIIPRCSFRETPYCDTENSYLCDNNVCERKTLSRFGIVL